jgi:hypothetical protein
LEGYFIARVAQDSPLASLDGSVRGETYVGALRAGGNARGWNWGLEAAYELGRVRDRALDRSAWAAAGHVDYTFQSAALRPSIQVGAAYASGDAGGPTYHGFDPLLPEVHAWHGAMDLFAWSNEAESSARFTFEPWTDALGILEYRYARLARAGASWVSAYLTLVGADPMNNQADLGHEIDASLACSPWAFMSVSAGYALLIFGEGARDILAVDQLGLPRVAQFAYAQATFRLP